MSASGCHRTARLDVKVVETSAGGNKLTPVAVLSSAKPGIRIVLHPEKQYQTITGFGGSFTESSANVLNRLSKENRNKILEAYFSKEGANYSLCRTHMNSCDFSLGHYSYAPVEDDLTLDHFSIDEDKDDLIPMIKDAMNISEDGFRIIASPWTAPPWMKDNHDWMGGRLLPGFYDTWAMFYSKYADAYNSEGITIWGFTVVNEPHGNGDNWESMLFTPEEMTAFVQHHLGPKLEADGKSDMVILGYDQNRAGLKEWVDVMYSDDASSKYYSGTAIHWYESTYEIFGQDLQYAHQKAPDKYLIQTEGCVDSEVPRWKDDSWYWSKEATDWGWDWAPEKDKYLHPKYVPVFRYARDIIGCLNNWVDGWIDWNMVLDKQGGPNWFKNWCVAPVIVDPENDEVYFTPLYYTMVHFSKFMRPGAKSIEVVCSDNDLMVAAVLNPDKTIAAVIFNPGEEAKDFEIELNGQSTRVQISGLAIQTIVI